MKGSYFLSCSVGEAHPALCTQHRWEGHASPWGKNTGQARHWPLGGSGQEQEPQRRQQSDLKCEEHRDEAAESRCHAASACSLRFAGRRREQKRREEAEEGLTGPELLSQESRENGAGWAGASQRACGNIRALPFPWLLGPPWGLGCARCFLGRDQRSLSPGRESIKPVSRPGVPMVLWGMQSSPVLHPHATDAGGVGLGQRETYSVHLRKGSGPDSWPLGHSWGSDCPERTAEEWLDLGARGPLQGTWESCWPTPSENEYERMNLPSRCRSWASGRMGMHSPGPPRWLC